MSRNRKYLPFLMWAFPLLFFTYQFILRLWPGLMMTQIMEQFSIDASSFGLLAALYYYGYSGMQIPIAIMLDRFSARYVIFIFTIICGIAAFAFNYTDNWYVACLSRFFIGVGSAVGFLGVSKVVSDWFPKEQYAKMIGYSFTIGLMGAIYGGKPVSLLIEHYSWQTISLALALFSIIIGCSTYLFLRSNTSAELKTEKEEQFRLVHFKKLLSSPIIWFIAIANLLMVGSLEGLGDVWGVQYLITTYGLAKPEAAELISFVFVGMIISGPLLALLSKYIGNYKVITLCGIGMAIAFILILSSQHYNWYYFATLFFLIGVMCCYQVIVFAAGAELVKVQLLGVTIAFLNCVNMLGGSFFHTIIGRAMDIFWSGDIGSDGLRLYNSEAYANALMVIPICSIIGALIIAAVGYKLKKAKND